MLFDAGAAEVHVRISSPPVIGQCFYGIDLADPDELIAPTKTVDEMREYIGATSLAYLSHDGLVAATRPPRVGALPRLPHGRVPDRSARGAREAPLRTRACLNQLLAEASRTTTSSASSSSAPAARVHTSGAQRLGRVRRRARASRRAAVRARLDRRDGRGDHRRAPRSAGLEPLLVRLVEPLLDQTGEVVAAMRTHPRRPRRRRRAARRLREPPTTDPRRTRASASSSRRCSTRGVDPVVPRVRVRCPRPAAPLQQVARLGAGASPDRRGTTCRASSESPAPETSSSSTRSSATRRRSREVTDSALSSTAGSPTSAGCAATPFRTGATRRPGACPA